MLPEVAEGIEQGWRPLPAGRDYDLVDLLRNLGLSGRDRLRRSERRRKEAE
jgi:hypothetical protein